MTLRLAVVSFVFALASTGCLFVDGPSCNSTNCANGCCAADDSCQVGSTSQACGSGGNLCDACTNAQVCQAGRCQFSTGTGGGFGGGGGGGGTTGGGMGGGLGGGTGGGMTGANTVSGVVTYEFVRSFYDPVADTGTLLFGQSVSKPVRNTVVRAMQGTAVLASSETGEDGRYTLSFTPSGTTPVRVVVISKTTNPVIQVQDNTDPNLALYGIGATVTGPTLDLNAAAGWTGSAYDPARRTAAPFAILDSMLTASRAFMAVRPVVFPALKVNWSPNNAPQNGDKTQGLIGTSHFAPSENAIYVLGKAGADADEFDSHVIVHEWGHFFEANLARSDSPGGRHGPGDVLDPRIAFGEAWGNAVASMVLPEVVYSDTLWSGATLYSFGFDTENEPNPTDDPTPSGFSESSVLRVLFDLYDSHVDGTFDGVATGLGPIYDVLTGPQRNTQAVTTLASFVTALKSQPTVSPTAVNTLLARYNIGPIVSDFGDGDPGLKGMFSEATSLPFTGSIALGGGNPANSWQQNQYYVFTGNGARATISANSAQDVAIVAYQAGREKGFADSTLSGSETFNFVTQAGLKYVVVLTGFGQQQGDYNVTVTITSP